MPVSRRAVLTAGGVGALAYVGLTSPLGNVLSTKSISDLSDRDFPRPFRRPFRPLPRLEPVYRGVDADGVPVEHYRVTAKAATATILDRLPTPVIGYNGLVPGPTISVENGTRVVLRVRNRLSGAGHLGHEQHGYSLSTHLHGHASLPQYDGYANDLTMPGYYKDYVYENTQGGRTFWFHDHASHITSQNVYRGLAGQFQVHDEAQRALLPQGRFDVGLTLGDLMFNRDGSLAFDDKEHSGLWGDVVLVNGVPWPVMDVQRRVYRFRLLNSSISRSYQPYLGSGEPVHMVATDNGLMPQSRAVTSWRQGTGERYEFLIDFSKYPPGRVVRLFNASLGNNVDFDNTRNIMAFRITDEPVDTSDPTWNTIPQTLANSSVMSLTESMSTRTRVIELKKSDTTNIFSLNETTWDDVVASGHTFAIADPALNAVETWEFRNTSGGWSHPMHVHMIDFKVLSRNGAAPFDFELGPKDTVYLGANEVVRIIARFPRQGRYMMHCHNLPHEDFAMMTAFNVGLQDGQPAELDPMRAAPPQLDDDPSDI